MTLLFSISLFVIAAVVTLISFHKCRRHHFYDDTFLLMPLGIFVWGDGVILGPFWMLAAIVFSFVTPLHILQFFLLFFAVRSAYEVVYWLNHQFTNRTYKAPLFRQVSWLDAEQSAILYQVMHTGIVVFTVGALIYSFLR